MTHAIGIVAGGGQFPVLVARGARERGRRVVMAGFVGHTDPGIAAEADVFAMYHLGQIAKLIAYFKQNGVTELCFAGAVSKPKALDLRPDFRAMKLLFSLRGKGDDALLRCLAEELAGEGLALVQPSALVPGLVAPSGVLTRRSPTPEAWDDIRFGWPIAQTVGKLDIGQCIVVRSGIVVAVEGIEGTDACLERGGELGGKGCTAIKIFKPGQDNRLDQPAIGPRTVEVMARHGYVCLAFQAGAALFFDREKALALADDAGIAIVGLPSEGPPEGAAL